MRIASAFVFINGLEVSERSLALVQSEYSLARILAPRIQSALGELVARSIL